MKISVIVPFHKYEAFLIDCLKSLCEMEFKDFEVLLINDHFEGKLEPILHGFQNQMDIKVFSLEEKTGVAAARNLGLRKATGTFVYFLDSDDYLFEEALCSMLEVAEEHEADVIYGKKRTSWFKRDIFLPTFLEARERRLAAKAERERERAENEENEEEDDEESTDDSTDDSAEEIADELAENVERMERTPEEIRERKRKRAIQRLFSKKKRLKQISVLHILFRRSFLEQYEITFPEEFKYYSDLPFMVNVLKQDAAFQRSYRALYIKRKHNDPIYFPALSQIRDENRFTELLNTYYYMTRQLEPGSELRVSLDKKMVLYYTSYFAPKLRRSDNLSWRNERFYAMQQVAKTIEPATFSGIKRYKKRLMKALYHGNIEKSIRIVTRHLARKKFKRLFRKKHEIARYFYRNVFLKKPLKENYVLCESFFGKNYSDSPKYIFEYLSKHYPGKYKFIWILEEKNSLPFPAVQIKRFSISYMYYLARSKYFIFNSRQPVWYKKREGMVFLETWHGTPLKKLVFDLEEVYSASPLYKKEVHIQSRKWDYLIAANQFSSNVFKSCFRYEGQMLEYGYPRNDLMHDKNRDQIEADLRKKLGLPAGKKTILYAPTWRDDEYYGKGSYKFELKLDLHLLKEKLGKDYVVLLRTHYFISDALDVTGLEDFAYNFSKYNDITELYLVSDMIITDYSSVFFDYANLKRPMLFFTYDLDKYRDVLRGFYIDIEEELPGPLLFTNEEIIDAIQDIEALKEKYAEKYERFYKKYCGWEDGHASENVANVVFQLKS